MDQEAALGAIELDPADSSAPPADDVRVGRFGQRRGERVHRWLGPALGPRRGGAGLSPATLRRPSRAHGPAHGARLFEGWRADPIRPRERRTAVYLGAMGEGVRATALRWAMR